MPKAVRSFFPAMSLMLVVCQGSACAHDQPHQRIDEVSLELEHHPEKLDLYIQRGELYRHTSQWDLALLDFDRVLLLDPEHQTVNFHCGRLLFEAGHYPQARIALDHFLLDKPHHPEGLLLRARVLRKLKLPLLAVQDYSQALSLASYPSPVLLIEQAEALIEVDQANVDLAIQSLDEAIEKHGPLILLESCAIDLELEHRHYEAALARIDRILLGMKRQERWLVRRGQILQRAGRIEAARATYEDALKSVLSLPARLQQTPASQALVANICDLLGREHP